MKETIRSHATMFALTRRFIALKIRYRSIGSTNKLKFISNKKKENFSDRLVRILFSISKGSNSLGISVNRHRLLKLKDKNIKSSRLREKMSNYKNL